MDPRLLAEAGRRRGRFALAASLGFGAGLATVAQAWYLTVALDAVLLRGAELADVRRSLFLLVAATLARAVLVGGERLAATRLAIDLSHDLRRRLLDHLDRVGPVFLGGEQAGEIQTSLGEGLKAVEAWFADYLPQIFQAFLVPLTVAAIIFTRDLPSAVVLIVTAPLIPLFMILIANLVETQSRNRFSALNRLGAFFLEVLQGMTTLKILGRSEDQVAAVRRVTEKLRTTTMAVLRLAFLSALVLELLATLSVAIVAVAVGLRLLGGGIEFRDAFFVLVLAPEFYLPLRLLGQRFHAGMEGVTAADRLFEIFAFPTLRPVSNGRSLPMPNHPTLELSAVHLSYPTAPGSAGHEVLRGLNLRLERGETVALVGPSGAGKTTIANLLLRFLDPDSGLVTADSIPTTEISSEAWRRRFAWVPQEPHLLADSALANINIGRPDATPAEVRAAASRARAMEFIEELPHGWHTQIGEHGARLSGGQVQRLALARAFLRDAPILILDEPGAGLDPLTLSELEETTAELLRGRTALVIAHRPTTAKRADKVAAIEDGRIVQLGSFSDLSGRDGVLRRMLSAWGGGA